MIDVALGGRAAEEMIFGHDDVTSGCSSDLQRATDVAARMIRVCPMFAAESRITDSATRLVSSRMEMRNPCISLARRRMR
jgi:ATP-dependent Zn protease